MAISQVRRRPLPLRLVRARPRLFASATIGLIVIGVVSASTDWRLATRLLTGWDIGTGLYLALAYHMMARAGVHHIRRNAAMQDEGQLTMLILTVVSALASVGAIFAELSSSTGAAGSRRPMHMVVAIVTIVLSWIFIHTIFALHYAHEFYDETAGGGIVFPGGEPEPDYWDFVYFSFVIGMTSQVSDVGITSKLIRRTATAHGIVSFLFNAALLALTVNVAASALSSN
jgi:uncharacterized membrane protein